MNVCFFTTRDFLTDVDQEPVISLFADEWRCSGDKEMPVRYRPRPASLVYYRSPSRVRKGGFRRHALLLRSPVASAETGDVDETDRYLQRLGFVRDDAFEFGPLLRRHALDRGFGPETVRRSVVHRFVRELMDLVYDDHYGLPNEPFTGKVEWHRCVPRIETPPFALQK